MMNPRRVLLEKISDVQRELMTQEFGSDYDSIVPVVLDVCQKHGLTFYFNFLEDSVVLNIIDWTSDDYSELHARLNIRVLKLDLDMNTLKFLVLSNAFLLTEHAQEITNPHKCEAVESVEKVETDPVEELIFTSDEPIPPHISKAMETIHAKGIPVTKESLKNHIPWDKISTEQRVKCTDYLNKMGAS